MEQPEPYWGKEAVCDIRGCNLSYVKDPARIASFAKELVKRLDMEAWGEPQVIHFGVGDKAGWTLVQLITTSNIVAHFNDVDGSCYLNVFSCKDFTPDIVDQCIAEFFEPAEVRTRFLIRNAH